MRKLFYLVCCLVVLLCESLVLSGCIESDNGNGLSENFYTCYTFDMNLGWQDFAGVEYIVFTGKRKYHFIYEWTELKTIFEDSTGFEIGRYFEEDILKKNFILCVARAEPVDSKEINYADFKVKKLKLSIKEVRPGDAMYENVLSRYLDFVVIPKKLLPQGYLNMDLGYTWDVELCYEE